MKIRSFDEVNTGYEVLEYCCERMEYEFGADSHKYHETSMSLFGKEVHYGWGSDFYEKRIITHCPWCGEKISLQNDTGKLHKGKPRKKDIRRGDFVYDEEKNELLHYDGKWVVIAK